MMRFADRLSEITAFKAMKVLDRANELEAEGKDVIHLEVGEPDFPTPSPIVAAARAALAAGATKYTPAPGIPALRVAIADHYQRAYGLKVDKSRIFVTAGGSGALLLSMALLLNKGDGVLMTDPGYPCNRHFVKNYDGEAQLIPVNARDNYQLTAAHVREHWRDNTRAVLLASPANPTGSVLSQSQLHDVAVATQALGGTLVVDEIYHGLSYGEAALPTALVEGAVVVNSFSKYYGMTGWRLGWLVVPDEAIENVEKLAQNLFICPSTVAQHAALAAFQPEATEIMEGQRVAFAERRDVLVAGLRELGFGLPLVPEGAFYVYAELPEGVTESSETFCQRLLEEQGVAVTPGTDFGSYQAERFVRFSYANRLPALKEALVRIKRLLQ